MFLIANVSTILQLVVACDSITFFNGMVYQTEILYIVLIAETLNFLASKIHWN